MKSFFIIGGAGFIGSRLVELAFQNLDAEKITVYDNFSAGREWHLAEHRASAKLSVVHADVRDLDKLCLHMAGHQTVIHLASNPDIARAATDPDIDFEQGTVLTRNVVEAMRRTSTPTLLYASGSGVYGDKGSKVVSEDEGDMIPISTYGASKLAGETLIASYCHMFGLTARAFRFGNVVGPRQTHGVGFDFLKRLSQDPTKLRILGDGSQSKPYVHVDDIGAALFTALHYETKKFQVYNVATPDQVTVNQIAQEAIATLGIDPKSVNFEYTGGDRGWKGDVPIVKLSSERIRALGWAPKHSSLQAIQRSLAQMKEAVLQGLI